METRQYHMLWYDYFQFSDPVTEYEGENTLRKRHFRVMEEIRGDSPMFRFGTFSQNLWFEPCFRH